MYKVGEVAKLFNINDQTLRVWCRQFGDYLSPGATPPKGAVRDFSEDDLRVLRYVQYALSRGHTYDEVWSQLADGNALKSFDEVFSGEAPITANAADGGGLPVNAAELVERYAVTVGRLGEVTQERDHLRGALETERAAHGTTRERAAAAEERARLLAEASKPTTPPAAPLPSWAVYVALVALLAIVALLAVVAWQIVLTGL